jgi:phosphate:Na+ symporter
MAEFAINLEIAGDIVAKRLLPLAREKAKKGLSFSTDGWAELRSMHETVMANIRLATSVLVSDDLECARMLVAVKSDIGRFERSSRKGHLKRLSEGGSVSFESSDIYLETLRGLKDLNSQFSAVAYPILIRGGQLLETRLIKSLDEAHPEE